ncbi:uncharacterized protein LOC124438702 [Xenia sp. Carnegie-2017]|uniref:uncharacterized protein LOC124438702 n=1 Tax=Xenia sp. Carnegie-2017 TaxID=2897299 RepID=UPI001F04DE1C|nr:uncharacterized protein LOC124438702 [Xenia sp. Carnegie-2017]
MTFPAAPENSLELQERYLDSADGNSTRISHAEVPNEEIFDAAAREDVKTDLQIAAKKGCEDDIQKLLTEKADLKYALLRCVYENDLQCLEELLTYHKKSDDRLLEPIIKAAQLGHYKIVEHFMSKDYLIDDPDKCEYKSERCKLNSEMLRSRIAINCFRGLSSPVYMCLGYLEDKIKDNKGNTIDPLSQAFELNKKLQKRARDEPELKKEYMELSDKCKTFTTELNSACRDKEDLMALLDIDEKHFAPNDDEKDDENVKKESSSAVATSLKKAINSNDKEFVAHPHTQMLVNFVVYSGLPKNIQRTRIVYRLFLFIFYTIFFPVFALQYLFCPCSKISKMMSTPYLKFVSHISQFIIFLFLIAGSSLRDNHTPTVIEYIIFLTVIGMVCQEIREMRCHDRQMNYVFKWWNINMIIMLTLFVMAGLSWIAGFAITGGWSIKDYSVRKYAKNKDGYNLLLLGNSFFSVASVFSVIHLIDFCQVNSRLGPLQLSLYRMIQDVVKFLILFSAIFLAFVMGLRNLYSYYNSIQDEIIKENKNLSDRRILEDTNKRFSTLFQSSKHMFWALFDKIELSDFDTKDSTFEITQETGRLLFAMYSILAVLIALNMLIAMMSHSYDYISQDDDIQWKFSRTKLWLEFMEKGSTLPAPYNLISIVIELFCKLKQRLKRESGDTHSKDQPSRDEAQDKRKEIIKRLIRRYVLAQKAREKQCLGTAKDMEESKICLHLLVSKLFLQLDVCICMKEEANKYESRRGSLKFEMTFAASHTNLELQALHLDSADGNSTRISDAGVSNEEFFNAVASGDVEAVQSKIKNTNNPVDFNAINSDGKTALQIAAENDRKDVIEKLLTEKADLKYALLRCVYENDLQCLEVLLTYHENSDDRLLAPTIKAAQLRHYEIVEHLMSKGYFIDDPDKCEYKSESCKLNSEMLRSQIAINCFRGLSSPVHMCLGYLKDKIKDNKGNTIDPLSQAFELNKKLQKRARDEPELRKEYMELSDKCKTFTAELNSACRNKEDLMALLDIDQKHFAPNDDENDGENVKKESCSEVVTSLKKAINSNDKEFVAHPHTQMLVNFVVYSGFPKNIQRTRIVYRLFLFIFYTIFFPVFALQYLFCPCSKISIMMSTPYMKFVSHISQFIIFLFLIAGSSLRDNHTPTVIEYIIFLTVIGMVCQEIREMRCHDRQMNYVFKWWNINMIIMLTLFVMAGLSWIAGFAITGGWSIKDYSVRKYAKNKDGYNLLLLGNSFFSVATVFSVIHLIDFCQVNSTLGPLQLSLHRMIQDVVKFLILFSAIFLAFAMGLRNLYSYYNSIQDEIIKENKNLSDKRILEDTNKMFSTLFQSSKHMFWALFDKIELSNFDTKDSTFEITQETGRLLFAMYSILVVLIALNMLIAMMSHSYDYISQDDDIQWKFSRTKLWLEFMEKGSTLPAPYNLISIVIQLFCKLNQRLKGEVGDSHSTDQTSRDEAQDKVRVARCKYASSCSDLRKHLRKKIMKRLIRRYFQAQEARVKQ